MTIEFKGKMSLWQFEKIAEYIKANEIEIMTMQKPIYIYEAKITKIKRKVIIELC